MRASARAPLTMSRHRSRSISTSKSQKRMTCHPAAARASFACLSRSCVRLIFASQYSPDLPGVKNPGWPCQKRPSTKTATCQRVNATSGLPGSWRVWQRQPRSPRAQRPPAEQQLRLGIARTDPGHHAASRLPRKKISHCRSVPDTVADRDMAPAALPGWTRVVRCVVIPES